MNRIAAPLLLAVFLAIFSVGRAAQDSSPAPEVPVKGMVTLVDIGGDSCTPCKMMISILREVEETYKGKAAVVSINIGKDRDRGRLFGARIIPTQVFYDREGREVARHEGFMDKRSIIEIFEKLGVR